MIYLYGLVASEETASIRTTMAKVQGLVGMVELAAMGGVHLIFEPHEGGEILPRRRSLLTHARVLETAMDAGTVLPMRFGMTCASVGDVEALLERDSHKIRGAFQNIENHVEFGVRVVAPEAETLATTLEMRPDLKATRDRLSTRGAEAHFSKVDFGRALGDAAAERRAQAQKTILSALRPMASDHLLKAPESDFDLLRAEFLVKTQDAEAFSDRLDHVVSKLDIAGGAPCQARIVGPGPAFHFVDLSLDLPVTKDAA